MAKKEWIDKLSSEAKAEILASVLHEIGDHMPEVMKKLPRRLQKNIRRALHDCGIWHDDLTKKDIKLINEWFNDGKSKS